MRIRSYSKINLWLRVVGKRADGFHEIETVFHSVSLCDSLTIERAPSIAVEMEPPVTDNLAERAARSLAARVGGSPGASIAIRKRIPIGAGLAGGSGNAAAVLRGLNQLWEADLEDAALGEIAAGLGSDVPFMLHGGTRLGRGRGERLSSIGGREPGLWFVLGISKAALATADVYGGWVARSGDGSSLDDLRRGFASGDVDELAEAIRNDLEAPALHLRPELADRMNDVEQAGALRAFVSGSGPTIVGLARAEGDARDIAGRLHGVFDRVEVVHSVPRSIEFEA